MKGWKDWQVLLLILMVAYSIYLGFTYPYPN